MIDLEQNAHKSWYDVGSLATMMHSSIRLIFGFLSIIHILLAFCEPGSLARAARSWHLRRLEHCHDIVCDGYLRVFTLIVARTSRDGMHRVVCRGKRGNTTEMRTNLWVNPWVNSLPWTNFHACQPQVFFDENAQGLPVSPIYSSRHHLQVIR